MAENQVKITYHIYLEAEDVSQSRILSSTSYVKNLFKNCGNHYFQGVDFDDESDLDDFTLRLFVEQDRKSTRLNSSHRSLSRMPSSA